MNLFISFIFLFAIILKTAELAPHKKRSTSELSYIADTEEKIKLGFPTKERVEYWTNVIDTIFREEIRPMRKEAYRQAEENLRKELAGSNDTKQYSVFYNDETNDVKDQKDDDITLEDAQKAMLSEKSETDWFALMEDYRQRLDESTNAYEKAKSEVPEAVANCRSRVQDGDWLAMYRKYRDFGTIRIYF